MTGLLGDLRGLKEGFMVVFVASERWKMEKFELTVSRKNYLCFLPQKRLSEGRTGETACPQAASAERLVAVCETCLTCESKQCYDSLPRHCLIDNVW